MACAFLPTRQATADYPAMQLFLLHARRLHPHYQPDASDVTGMVEICRQVHGMPLGILLAAAWSRAISPRRYCSGDKQGSELLADRHAGRSCPAAQSTRGFLHTWNRLSSAERQVFMRLSVFRGGATGEAARQVTSAAVDVLAVLIDMPCCGGCPTAAMKFTNCCASLRPNNLRPTMPPMQAKKRR